MNRANEAPSARTDEAGDPSSMTEATFWEAVGRVAATDPVLAAVKHRWGPPPFWQLPAGFAGLVHGILAQQVSLESASSAFANLEQELGTVTPAGLLALDADGMKAIGFSRQKTSYVRGLATSIAEGALDLAALETASDDDVRTILTRVRGIGRWTADVYMLFALRRPDAWPHGDLALAQAVQHLWDMPERPDFASLDVFAERWRPFRAVAARFLWHDYLCRRGREAAGRALSSRSVAG